MLRPLIGTTLFYPKFISVATPRYQEMRIFALILALFAVGCGNLSPRDNFSPEFKQQLNNQNGRIGEIETLQNSIKAEIGRFDGKLSQIQQGFANSSNQNSGIQILSGPGGLMITLVGLVCVTMLMLHYRKLSIDNDKISNMLAERIAQREDPELEEQVFQACMYTDVEQKVYSLVTAHKTNLQVLKTQSRTT